MTLVKLSRPYGNCTHYGTDMAHRNDVLNNFLNSFNGNGNGRSSYPPANIIDEEKQFRIQLAAPGYEKADFNLSLEKNLLTISVNKEILEQEDVRYLRSEFANQGFERRFVIGKAVDASKIDATYTNGILDVILAKAEHAIPKPPRAIEVK